MLRVSFLLTLFFFVVFGAAAQESAPTTIILVRHAEKAKDDPKDPSLSKEGLQRVERLSKLLASQEIDAIYSTPLRRTMGTVQPLADKNELEIQHYKLQGLNDFLQKIISDYPGGTVIISGHSNTTPHVANVLLGKEQFEQFDDSDYSNLLIITATAVGNGVVTVLKF